jgi:hypothetical protein
MASSVWKGHITFGLITIPVRLLRAARSERVPLRELSPSRSRALSRKDEEAEPELERPIISPPARGKGLVRIDRKSAESDAPSQEPVFEPVRRMPVGLTSDEPLPARDLTKGFEPGFPFVQLT